MAFLIGKYLQKITTNDTKLNTITVSDIYTTNNSEEFSIDYNYEIRKKSVKSNAELTNLNEEFANIWQEKIGFYYQEICDYFISKSNNEMMNQTLSMQEKWNAYYKYQINYYEEFMLSVYDSGSIVPIKLSNYNLLLNRNKAIQLYYLCLNLGIEIKAP